MIEDIKKCEEIEELAKKIVWYYQVDLMLYVLRKNNKDEEYKCLLIAMRQYMELMDK